jgi:hypothetical protein
MEENFESNRSTVRFAASLFIFLCVPLSLWGEVYIQSKVFVAQDPVATANNLLAYESVFRLSIVTHIFGTFIYILMMLLFYRVFKPVDKFLGLLMIIPVLALIPIAFVFEIFNYAALMVLKSEAHSKSDTVQQQDLAYFLLRLHRYGVAGTKMFSGLAFLPFGALLLKSRLAPSIIGILFIIGGVSYIMDTSLYLLLQRSDYLLIRSFTRFVYLTYMVSIIWFAIKGLSRKNVLAENI